MRIVDQSRRDIVLLDAVMPGMDGLNLPRLKEAGLSNVPVIFMTAWQRPNILCAAGSRRVDIDEAHCHTGNDARVDSPRQRQTDKRRAALDVLGGTSGG